MEELEMNTEISVAEESDTGASEVSEVEAEVGNEPEATA